MTKEKNMTVTSKNKMEFTCPYCNAKFEFEENKEGVIIHAPDDRGFLPEGRKNQTMWLIAYSFTMVLVGVLLHRFIEPLM